jgi:hypothetical protein
LFPKRLPEKILARIIMMGAFECRDPIKARVSERHVGSGAKMQAHGSTLPTANMYPRSGYARRLKDAGFTGVCVRVPSLALLENIEDGMCWHLSQQKIGRITNEP